MRDEDSTITKTRHAWQTILAPIERESDVFIRQIGPAIMVTGRVRRPVMPLVIGRQGATIASIGRLMEAALPGLQKIRVSMAEPSYPEDADQRAGESLDAAAVAIFDLVGISGYHVAFREDRGINVLDLVFEARPAERIQSGLINDALRVIRAGAYRNGQTSVQRIDV